MPRTTIDIDGAVLRELKRRQRTEKKSLGQLVSELLAMALHQSGQPVGDWRWNARPMGARVDLEDKEAVRRTLEGR